MTYPRKTLLIITQVYPPDPAAVGQHIADVAKKMAARGWRVIVYTASRGYDDPSICFPAYETADGVQIRRLPFSSLGKTSIAIRLLAQALFMSQAFLRSLCIAGLTRILVSTSPPFAGFGGALLSYLRRTPLVWWLMDLNPDQLIASGRISSSSLIARGFDWMNRFTLRQARSVIVLDRFMKDRILTKAPVAVNTHIIPPWAHSDVLEDVPHAENPFRATHGLDDRFVVMYAGNHGYATPVEAMLDAARMLANNPRIVFAFVGGGVLKPMIDDYVSREKPTNVLSLPYQPLADIRFSLSAADVHLVSLAPESVGIVHPCKVYGALAIGRPVIAMAPLDSYLADIVRSHDVGWLCTEPTAAALADLVGRADACGPLERARLSASAKQLTTASYRSDRLSDAVCDLLA